VAAVPYLAFIDEAGQLAQIIPGFVAPDFFLVFLEYVRTKAYTETDFDRFVENLSRRAE
jgi:thioredoxin-related protein